MSVQNSKQNLLEKRTELENRINAIKQDIASGLNPDSSEQAIQLENYEVLFEILKSTEVELDEINRKLYEIDHAIYG